MPSIGTIPVNLHTVDRNDTVYTRASHTVSHVDTVALRRTPAEGASKPLRTNVRFERGFSTPASATTGLEKSVTVSIAVTTPPGVDPVAVKAYIVEALTQAADVAADVGTTGDIHL